MSTLCWPVHHEGPVCGARLFMPRGPSLLHLGFFQAVAEHRVFGGRTLARNNLGDIVWLRRAMPLGGDALKLRGMGLASSLMPSSEHESQMPELLASLMQFTLDHVRLPPSRRPEFSQFMLDSSSSELYPSKSMELETQFERIKSGSILPRDSKS